MKYLLFYDYVEDVLERRVPLREEHLGLAGRMHADGPLVMAGAFTDPLDGAVFVFTTREAAEGFPALDPYVANGLVTRWHVREWNVVVGGYGSERERQIAEMVEWLKGFHVPGAAMLKITDENPRTTSRRLGSAMTALRQNATRKDWAFVKAYSKSAKGFYVKRIK